MIPVIESLSALAFERIDRKLPPLLYTMKNPAFEEEEEWRVVSTYSSAAIHPSLSYQAGRNKISPFISLPLGNGENPISEVIIGPKNITPPAVVKAFLGQYAPDAEVRPSVATYR